MKRIKTKKSIVLQWFTEILRYKLCIQLGLTKTQYVYMVQWYQFKTIDTYTSSDNIILHFRILYLDCASMVLANNLVF